ncbi:hypothetical protein TNIN_97181 [Trichonephila inaurata madagascariensis]|uniref:Uncharacterized protein n=1 Tax=Trichonephila inaurata madagascariensis TaxID=2747483 RepID=A0A8X7CB14_9ARAC|nr:hypothetical protein TNIN_97161 [Trichonephila inaurata madagascariensis]GFY59807.1 hypothetical protein TNIN_97181 [Trichonephila inaurata madagascariensis]
MKCHLINPRRRSPSDNVIEREEERCYKAKIVPLPEFIDRISSYKIEACLNPQDLPHRVSSPDPSDFNVLLTPAHFLSWRSYSSVSRTISAPQGL